MSETVYQKRNGQLVQVELTGAGSTITVDNALSSSSTNPVQNKVINTALGTKANDSDVVKLTGDQTISGAKTFSGTTTHTGDIIVYGTNIIKKDDDGGTLYLCGGISNANVDGARIELDGSGKVDSMGNFSIIASNLDPGYGTYALKGTASGTLTWDDKDIAIDENVVHKTGNETIGGVKTFTSKIILPSGTPGIVTTTANSYLQLCAGQSNQNAQGATLSLVGIGYSTNPGTFALKAANSTNNAILRGKPDGTLTWADKGFVYTSGDQTLAGIKTFSSPVVITHDNVSVRRSNKTGALRLTGGNSESAADGAMLSLFGSSQSNLAGYFRLYTGNGPCLEGRPNGTLTWNDRYFIYADGEQTISGTKTFSAANLKFTANTVSIVKELSGNPSSTRGMTIGIKNTAEAVNAYMAVTSHWWSSMNAGVTITFRNPNETAYTAYGVTLRPWNNAVAYFMPDNANIYLGRNAAGYKWKQLIADTATISTSDERLKSSIDAIPDAVLDAWGDVDWRQFQFKDAVAEKGIDKARLHTGLIAQRIDSIFKAHKLDVSRYGLWCVDHWDATSEERDEKGNIVTPAREAEDAYAVRYEEALCIEAAYQRRRADRAEARISALEEQIAEIKKLLGVN